MQLKIYEFDMKLKYPFSISRHTYYSQPNIIIELLHGALSGFGEATINPYYNITISNLKDSFEAMNQRLKNYTFITPDQLFDDFSEFIDLNSFALGALNNASWDLYGKIHDITVSELIELPQQPPPFTSYTLGIDTKETMVKKMAEFPWPIYKIKLGTDNDFELLQHIRKHTKAMLRLDANCAWDADKTIEMSKKLSQLGVEFIEQPLPVDNIDQQYCFDNVALPLIADESCCKEEDVQHCSTKFHGINIKLLKCGGLSPAIRMIKEARKLQLKVMIGCMTETSVGISAAAQLLQFVDYADLDGPLLLAKDVAGGLEYKDGRLSGSNNNGLGIIFMGKN